MWKGCSDGGTPIWPFGPVTGNFALKKVSGMGRGGGGAVCFYVSVDDDPGNWSYISFFRWLHEAGPGHAPTLQPEEPLLPRVCLQQWEWCHVPGLPQCPPLPRGSGLLQWQRGHLQPEEAKLPAQLQEQCHVRKTLRASVAGKGAFPFLWLGFKLDEVWAQQGKSCVEKGAVLVHGIY